MGADCKSAGYAYVGSNPTRPILSTSPCSSAVEHSLGKGEVSGSSPDEGTQTLYREHLSREKETSRGLFFNANALLLLENLRNEQSRTFSISQKSKINVLDLFSIIFCECSRFCYRFLKNVLDFYPVGTYKNRQGRK